MTPASPRHPFELLLEQLTAAMSMPGHPLRHGFGVQEDAEHTSKDRIVWIPGDLALGPLRYSLPDDATPSGQEATFDVSIYGGSPVAVYSLHEQLCGWIDNLIGPSQGSPPSEDGTFPERPGYDIGKAKVTPRGGTAGPVGWGTTVPITLYKPGVSLHRPQVQVTQVLIDIEVTDPEDLTPEVVVETP